MGLVGVSGVMVVAGVSAGERRWGIVVEDEPVAGLTGGEVDDEVRAFGGSDQEAVRAIGVAAIISGGRNEHRGSVVHDGGGQESTFVTDLNEGRTAAGEIRLAGLELVFIEKVEIVEAGLGAVENNDAVAARLDLKVRIGLAVDDRRVREKLWDAGGSGGQTEIGETIGRLTEIPTAGGVTGRIGLINGGVPEITGFAPLVGDGLECLVLNDERDGVSEAWDDSCVDERGDDVVAHQVSGCEPGIGVEAGDAESVVVIPEEACALVVGIVILTGSGVPGDSVEEALAGSGVWTLGGGGEPGVGAAITGPGDETAVEVDGDSILRGAVIGSHEGCIDRERMLGGEEILHAQDDGTATLSGDDGAEICVLSAGLIHIAPELCGLGEIGVHELGVLDGGEVVEIDAGDRGGISTGDGDAGSESGNGRDELAERWTLLENP